ncbi:MAG: hypothetical protein LIO81_00950 [Clostridiales bacterium]|nr:hypothetical protein [Clostridiales bacterium]
MKDGSKYGKYILYAEEERYDAHETLGTGIQIVDQNVFEGSNYYLAHWVLPTGYMEEPEVGHPPHMHKEHELLFCIGTDPDNPYDLGGELEISIGEELEHHVINRTCCICLPGGVPHGFYRVLKTTRPWIFLRVHQAAQRTEKALPELMKPEQIAKMKNPELWKSVGFDGD